MDGAGKQARPQATHNALASRSGVSRPARCVSPSYRGGQALSSRLEVRLDAQRFRKLRNSFVEPPQAGQQPAQIVVDTRIVGLEPRLSTEFDDRFIQSPPAQQGDSQAMVCLGVIGPQPDRLTKFLYRLVRAPHGAKHPPQN